MIFENKVLGIYKKKLIRRLDGDGSVFYFGKEDFPGLCADDVSFLGDKGQRLYGHFYFRGDKRYDRLMILDHGMGCGHASYLKEIDVITRRGYTVFTYDHTGTLDSEGKDIGGFSQSLSDLDRAVAFVRSLDEYKDASISVIGHSWGGFSAMNIAALYPDITHVVAISGFISPRAIQHQALSGILVIYRPTLYKLERDALPDYYLYDGRESMKKAKNTKTLFIHSRDDKTCSFKAHFEELRRALEGEERIEFLAVDNKNHHPQYTEEAVKYKAEFNRELRRRIKNGTLNTDEEKAEFVNSYDFHKMAEQDETFWNAVFEFLEK